MQNRIKNLTGQKVSSSTGCIKIKGKNTDNREVKNMPKIEQICQKTISQ